uniref:RNA-binding protein with serine-rich domain 1 n=1 Tax=Capra hircus TaxID=9925 RepID=A0A452GB38_CAPHI
MARVNVDILGISKLKWTGMEKMAPSPTRCRENSDEQSRDRSRDKSGPKESRDKYGGRARTRRWSGASSGSSSSRSPSSGSTSSGSSSGSSSPSASSRSGRSSTSCSSSSSSSRSPGSLRPSWLRRGKRQRSHSTRPERDEKEGRRPSPSPKPTKLHIARLTRNVTKDHIREIFSTFGKVRVIDMPVKRMHPGLSDAYVEFETPDGAEKALKYMDGGQIDGQEIRATAVPPPRRLSPHRRMQSLPPRWCGSPSQRRRRSPSPWLRSQKRWRPHFPRRPLHRSRFSSRSSRS